MKKHLIYIIEDSMIVQHLIELSIQRRVECDIKKFNTTQEALLSLRREKPDIIVLDHYLGIDGKENSTGLSFLRKLKKMGKKIPTIIFSGQHELSTAVDFIREGAVDYVSKNSSTFYDDLVSSVRKVSLAIGLKKESSDRKRNKRRSFLNAILLIVAITATVLGVMFFLE